MPAVGDTLYRFDQNHRVYKRGADGRPTGAPIFTEYFVPRTITGETPRSWICGEPPLQCKVSKSELREAPHRSGFTGYQWFTEDGKADRLWTEDHRSKIVRLVEFATANQLKQIAAIVGFDPNKKGSD